MSYLFVDDGGAYIGYEGNYMTVRNRDGMVRKIPVETVEAIYLFSSVQVTSQCVVQCLKRGINISYYSKGGAYFGRLQSTNHINVARQRKQAALADSDFSLNQVIRVLDSIDYLTGTVEALWRTAIRPILQEGAA